MMLSENRDLIELPEPPSILVADDSDLNREINAEILTEQFPDSPLLLAASGQEAESLIQRATICWLDNQMEPGKTGYQLAMAHAMRDKYLCSIQEKEAVK